MRADIFSEQWIIEPRKIGIRPRIEELWRYRYLFRYFAKRFLERTYKRTILGVAWLFIRPLFPVVVSTLIFGNLLGVESGSVPYFLFFMVGMASWHLFETSLMWVTRSLELNRRLITRVYFPRLILPVASISTALVEFVIYISLIFGAAAYFYASRGELYLQYGFGLVVALMAGVLTIVFAIGLGFWTSVPGATARDVRFSLRYVLQFWFYSTPVIYPISTVPEQWRWVVSLNPMATIVETFKWGMIGVGEVSPFAITMAFVLIGVTLASGIWFFARAEVAAVDGL